MEMYLWDNFKKEDVNSALIYWADYWKEKSELFGHLEYGSRFENPRTLLRLIQDEINFNGLEKTEMKQFFSERVKYYLMNTFCLDSKLQVAFDILKGAIPSQPSDYVYTVAHETEKEMDNGGYFRFLVTTLKTMLVNNESDLSKIKRVCDILIIEFILAGYKIEYVKNVPRKVMAFYAEISEGIVSTDFPHRVDYSQYKVHETEYGNKKYFEQVKAEINALTISDRIEAINSLYFKEEESITLIFQLRGIRGEVGDFKFDNVHIYSPKAFSYITDKNSIVRNSDAFSDLAHNSVTPANIAVTLSSRDPESSKMLAVSKAREVLNLFRFYLSSDVELSVNSLSCHAVDSQGRVCWQSSHSNPKEDSWMWSFHSIEVNDLSIMKNNGKDVFENFYRDLKGQQISLFAQEQVTHALHFFAKGMQSELPEDRLVNFWVCLEKLVADKKTLFSLNRSKFDLISILLPPVMLNRYLTNKAWTCFYFMRGLYGSSQGSRKLLPLTKELATKVQFETVKGDTIHLIGFVDNLNEILGSAEREIIREKISDLQGFYFDNKKSIDIFDKVHKGIRDDLLLIYRLRNKIVHDAHFDQVSIDIWANRLESYAKSFLGSIMSNHCRSPGKIHDYLLTTKVNYDKMISTLSKSKNIRAYDFAFKKENS